jgi:hypothetical protein
VGFLPYSTGTTAGDHKGDDLKEILDKLKTMCAELFGLVGSTSGYLAPTAITAASTDNYDPGSSWPSGYSWLDLNPSTNDIILTGLKAGSDAQSVTIRNIGSTYTIKLSAGGVSPGTGDAASIAANRFTGEGDADIPPGGQSRITYLLLPSPRWAIG